MTIKSKHRTNGLLSVETSDTKKCYICNSENVYGGGSWGAEKCLSCGAVYFFGFWHEPEPEDKTNVISNGGKIS